MVAEGKHCLCPVLKKKLSSREVGKQLVDDSQGVSLGWCCLVNYEFIVTANSYLSILYQYRNHSGSPRRKLYRGDLYPCLATLAAFVQLLVSAREEQVLLCKIWVGHCHALLSG